MYTVTNLRKLYSERIALNNISFPIEKHKITSVLGRNGSGKTTLIKCLTGLLLYESGSIQFGGQEINTLPRIDYYRQIAAVLEGNRNSYWYMSGEENILYFGLLHGIKKTEILKRAEPYLKRFSLYESKDQKLSEYSRGMQQKLSIVIALLSRPQVLFLDEPTLGLDIESKFALIEILNDLKNEVTIVLTSHQIDVVDKLSDALLVIDQGEQIYFGGVDEFKRNYGKAEIQIVVYDPACKSEQLFPVYKLSRKNSLVEIGVSADGKVEHILNKLDENAIEFVALNELKADLESIIRTAEWKKHA